MSIQSVTLTNFRGFRYHTVAFNDLSILVGHNNAGKSTLIDALRLLAVAAEKSLTATYIPAPLWIRNQTRERGFSTTFKTVEFDFENLGYNQDQDEPAKLELRFKNKSVVIIWLDTQDQANFIQIHNANKEFASSRVDAQKCRLTPVYIMPPIQRVLSSETVKHDRTIRISAYGRLAYRHFRNQLLGDPEGFKNWSRLLEESWHGLRVTGLDASPEHPELPIRLIISDPPFVSEVAWVGSGLQAWMQIIWFLSRTPENSSIILDEPDAYLHADLQRKLIKILADLDFLQVTVATHSAEIISDVDPKSIVVVKKRNRYSSKPAQKDKVQDIIHNLGSRHNVQLSKLSEARKVILYEGDDQKFLSQVALKFSGDIYNAFMMVPYFDIAGVQNWREAIGAAKALAAATADHVSAFLIIDRDFRSLEEIEEIRKVTTASKLSFHCWRMKEIENYFVSPVLLAKFVSARGNKTMSLSQASDLIKECCEQISEACINVINENYFRSSDLDAAQKHFHDVASGRELSEVVGGKRLIGALSAKLQRSWGCQLSAINLCRFAQLEDLDKEIVDLVKELSRR